MKKTYFAPDTNVYKVKTNQMICVSGQLDGKQSIGRSEDFGSRRGGWADDDDYDE